MTVIISVLVIARDVVVIAHLIAPVAVLDAQVDVRHHVLHQ